MLYFDDSADQNRRRHSRNQAVGRTVPDHNKLGSLIIETNRTNWTLENKLGTLFKLFQPYSNRIDNQSLCVMLKQYFPYLEF